MIRWRDLLLGLRSPRLMAGSGLLCLLLWIGRCLFRLVAPVPGLVEFDLLWPLVPVAVWLLGPLALVAACLAEVLADVVMGELGGLTVWRCLGLVWLGLVADALGAPSAGRSAIDAWLRFLRRMVPLLATDAVWTGGCGILSHTYPWVHLACWHLLLTASFTLVLSPMLSGLLLPRWQARFSPWWATGPPEAKPPQEVDLPAALLMAGGAILALVLGWAVSRFGYDLAGLPAARLGTRGGWGVVAAVTLGGVLQGAGYLRHLGTRDAQADRTGSGLGAYGVSPLRKP